MDTQSTSSATTRVRRRRDHTRIIRRLGAFVLAVAAAIVMVGLAPQDTVTTGDISEVMLSDTLNQSRTEGAPQQSVVNGWTARDLLELTAKQGVEARDHRPAGLMTLLVLGMCLALATSASPRRIEPEAPEVGPEQPSATAASHTLGATP